jgi:2-dehydropantoate 2-reductase
MDERRRYIVIGAGAIGCAIGGMLQRRGASVVFVARGAQLSALRDGGLLLATPSREERLAVSAVESPRAIEWKPDDIALLCTKSQDTAAALEALAHAAPSHLPVACAQNGVANERAAAALFKRVYGVLVFAPTTFLEPGVVCVHSEPVFGGLDIGVYPTGVDAFAESIARDLGEAGFDARAEPRILRLKYGKLLANLVNALQALGGDAALEGPLSARLREEAIACFRAAGIDFAPMGEVFKRNANVKDLPVRGAARRGGSSWQSLARGAGSIETDFLNGEIVALGDRLGVEAPLNRALCALSRRAAETRAAPGSFSLLSPEQLFAVLAAVGPER